MISELKIQNFKSVFDNTMEISNVNVLIGENGCGKTNILEAVVMLSASYTRRFDTISLTGKGIRITKPNLSMSSFLGRRQIDKICLAAKSSNAECREPLIYEIMSENEEDIYSEWLAGLVIPDGIYQSKSSQSNQDKNLIDLGEYSTLVEWEQRTKKFWSPFLSDFVIYNLETQALRGLTSNSKTLPLGINGEGLDILLSDFSKEEWQELLQFNHLISWLDEIIIDEGDRLKFKGHKLGRSNSILYFRDKYMRKNNNVFAAENSNEGILHVLFYLALVISKKTPKFFAIDNIETALNPQLCRVLMKELAALAIKHDKQMLITTHNPAILDGLNLYEDRQRLFVVARTDEGYTKTDRIKMKPKVKDQDLKLSELWMRGYLGGIPTNF